jgi:hypothetical protein
MQIAYHLGVHCTDEERLLKCLLKNKGKLAEQGIGVPGPGRYRNVVREQMVELRGRPASAEHQEKLLGVIAENEEISRVVLTNPSFMAAPARAIQTGQFYPNADQKTHWLSQLLPGAQVEFFVAIRNPATFLPALMAETKAAGPEVFLGDTDPLALQWSPLIEKIRRANPEASVTVWCNEDTPLIWPEILREMSGHEPHTQLDGIYDFHASIMTEAGIRRMLAYFQSHPPVNEVQRRRVVAAFLDKFANEDEIEVEIDLPGWDEDLVESMTEAYEEDIFAIERMAGVNLIIP